MVKYKEILDFCHTISDNVISNDTSIISPLSIDIYIPDLNIAIEFDDLLGHSANSLETESKNGHLDKTNICINKGIHLYHIFENEWSDIQMQKIWKSVIRNKLGKSKRIYARKTIVHEVPANQKNKFLADNHLQGDGISPINLGLYYNNDLVSIMTFGRSRYDKKVEWELIRFCNKINTSVVGAASKLLTRFLKTHAGDIITYADKRRSDGNLYKQIGFKFSHESGPNYFYYKDSMELHSRVSFQKHKLKDKLKLFDDDLTETENMYNNGYRKIFDCGNQVWKLENKLFDHSDFYS